MPKFEKYCACGSFSSAMVGTSGQAARRSGAITASGLSAPLATCGSTTSVLTTSSSTTPPRPSVSAWLLPR